VRHYHAALALRSTPHLHVSCVCPLSAFHTPQASHVSFIILPLLVSPYLQRGFSHSVAVLGSNFSSPPRHTVIPLLSVIPPQSRSLLFNWSPPWGTLLRVLVGRSDQPRMLGTMPEGRIRKEGLCLSSCAVPLTWVRAPNFRMKSRGHPTKFSWTLKVRQL
jgi:hypothetical protein